MKTAMQVGMTANSAQKRSRAGVEHWTLPVEMKMYWQRLGWKFTQQLLA